MSEGLIGCVLSGTSRSRSRDKTQTPQKLQSDDNKSCGGCTKDDKTFFSFFNYFSNK